MYLKDRASMGGGAWAEERNKDTTDVLEARHPAECRKLVWQLTLRTLWLVCASGYEEEAYLKTRSLRGWPYSIYNEASVASLTLLFYLTS